MLATKVSSVAALVFLSSFANAAALDIVEATDWGGTQAEHPPAHAIDGNTDWSSRWSASPHPANLVLDLGEVKSLSKVGIAWGKGDERSFNFEIRTRADASTTSWDKVYSGDSSGTSTGIEVYDVTDIEARWVRIKVFSASSGTSWTSITEAEVYDDSTNNGGDNGGGDNGGGTDYGLNPSVAPSENFELVDWYLSVPVDSGNGYATSIKENTLNASYEDEFFYTGTDGGMVFKTPVEGVKTSSGTKYTRTELREMLRRGDTSMSTSGTENNWAFSSIPSSSQSAFGGIDGVMKATLAVNKVTTTASNNEKVGRLVIGQIHAEKNEPIRLYYHKLPGNDKGGIYFAHEASKASGGEETWYNLLGNMVSSSGGLNSTSNPSNGIALDEHFSYNITVEGDYLKVSISQNGSVLANETVNMSSSGYDDADNYMYFKAGIYLQDNESDGSDYAQATFYELTNTHENYNY